MPEKSKKTKPAASAKRKQAGPPQSEGLGGETKGKEKKTKKVKKTSASAKATADKKDEKKEESDKKEL